jgi:hypothetical protein
MRLFSSLIGWVKVYIFRRVPVSRSIDVAFNLTPVRPLPIDVMMSNMRYYHTAAVKTVIDNLKTIVDSNRRKRWHGTTMATGFAPLAKPTARTDFGRPS